MQAILILNCGSSSVKFAVIEASKQTLILNGQAECLGEEKASITLKYPNKKTHLPVAYANHEKALTTIVDSLNKKTAHQLIAVGHRVVHGGEHFSASCLITDKVLMAIEACSHLAPLHNPPNIVGIRAAQKAYPQLPQVAVFDTAFHQTLSQTAYLYAIPYKYYRQYGIRRYGFHGTSYRYIHYAVTESYPAYADKKLVVAHLGNGASVCAIHQGQSVSTSMGLTPLDGLVQGTRTGSIDPAIVEFLEQQTKKTGATVTQELWKQSGLLGLSETSNDCRVLEEKAQAGDKACQRALKVFVTKLKETIGGHVAMMNGVDALIFTGGIGENSLYVREQTVSGLSYLNFSLDPKTNHQMVGGQQGNIALPQSKPIWVIPTNEERMIAMDTLALISKQ